MVALNLEDHVLGRSTQLVENPSSIAAGHNRAQRPSNHPKNLNSGNFEPQDWEIGKIPLPINVGDAPGSEVHVETNETGFWNSAGS